MFQTVITPSEEASQRHLAAIGQRLSQLRSASQAQVIEELNPLIDGWAAYYQGVVPADTLGRYDELVERLLLHWARGQHPTQGTDWLLIHYWRRIGEQARVFATADGTQLHMHRHPDMPTESQLKDPVSPSDGHLTDSAIASGGFALWLKDRSALLMATCGSEGNACWHTRCGCTRLKRKARGDISLASTAFNKKAHG